MDKKFLYIGLVTLFFVLVSTLFLIILVIKPNLIPINIVQKTDSTAIIKGGVNDSLSKNPQAAIYDSINACISTLVIKRENLIITDSLSKLLNIINYNRVVIDSLKLETGKLSDSSATNRKKYLDYVKSVSEKEKIAQIEKKPAFTEQEQKGYAKIYESMTPENAAKQLEQMSELESVKILLNIDSKQGAKILDKMDSKKAAKLWNALNSKGTK